MCFYNDDYAWTAEVSDVTDGTADSPAKCYECNSIIAAGEFRRYVYQQEHEECSVCEQEEADEPCEKHDYGETFECNLCESCVKILKAIYAVEINAGCPPYASQPNYGELQEAFQHDDAGKYRARALTMFPGVAGHKFLEVR